MRTGKEPASPGSGLLSQEREPEDFRDFDLDWMRCGITGSIETWAGRMRVENDVSTVEDLRDCEDTTVNKNPTYVFCRL